ncbi:MAG: ATP/GTP-binding protein [Archaeoglobus sp.]|nr:ATP/GTP-binding protein [Archaeoglobus sp.]
MNILILGHAGSGKSTLVKNFGEYLVANYSVRRVNLDPATRPIFKADADCREFVKTEEVMEKFKLGINGALLKSIEILGKHIHDLILEDDFVLYDTPGQLELFLYTDFGERFSEKLKGNAVAIFLIDSSLCQTPENYLSAVFQSAVVSLRTSIPTLTVFNKTDIKKPLPYSEIERLIEKSEGVLSEAMVNLLPFYNLTSLRYRTIEISAQNGDGFDDLFSAVNEVLCACGDIS